jgi:hypothetical protein
MPVSLHACIFNIMGSKNKHFIEVLYISVFRTIFYISIIYAIGNVVIAIASATGAIEVPAR